MLLAVLFAVDTTKSVQSALDLKSLLNSMSASSQQLAGWSNDSDRLLSSLSKAPMLSGLQAALHKAEIEDAVRRDRDYQRAVSILYRNPTAISRQNKEAFRELLTLKREKSNRKAES